MKLPRNWSELGRLQKIRLLEAAGILGDELCPEPDYWHWPVLKPEELPEDFKQDFDSYREVRLY